MLDESFWHKKFSIGLAMTTTYSEYERFINSYAKYIDNVYVSLPIGKQFHGREHIQKQFENENNVALFWKLVSLINNIGINLEVVFNTHLLSKDDLIKAKTALIENGISVQKISVLDKYYDDVRELFPNAMIVKSVNQMPISAAEIQGICKEYDEIVVGRELIRRSDIFHIIKEKGAKTVLLLNNGCSFACGGCRNHEYCEAIYKRDCNKYGAEYLYAQQSILPYELHEGFFDISDVSLFKLSTRNADTEFTQKCLDSYIHDSALEYLKIKKENYLLWARLQWHMAHYSEFDYERIKHLKKVLTSAG